MNEENFCTFPEVFIWTSPLGPMDVNLSDSFEKTVVKEGGGAGGSSGQKNGSYNGKL